MAYPQVQLKFKLPKVGRTNCYPILGCQVWDNKQKDFCMASLWIFGNTEKNTRYYDTMLVTWVNDNKWHGETRLNNKKKCLSRAQYIHSPIITRLSWAIFFGFSFFSQGDLHSKKRKTERRNKEHRITTTIKQPKQFQTIPTSIKKGEKQTNKQKETQPTSKQNTCSQHRVSLCFHGFDIPSCCSVGIFVNSQGIRICSVIALAQAFLATQPEYSICYLENGPFFEVLNTLKYKTTWHIHTGKLT